MPPPAATPEPDFLGAKNPGPGRPFRAALLGSPGAFFESLLRASAFVELYDEELDCEPFRRGIRTERVPPAALSARLGKVRSRGAFPCLAGYGPSPVMPAVHGLGETVVLAPEVAPWRGAALILGVRSGGRGGGPRPPSGKVLSAREILAGRGRRLSPPHPTLLVIDPHVMDPALFPVRRNLEPGGLTWYPLTALLKALFESRTVAAVLMLPAALPPSNPLPSFMLAKLTAKVLAYALCR